MSVTSPHHIAPAHMGPTEPYTGAIAPAEAQFWREQAQRAPQLLRAKIPEANAIIRGAGHIFAKIGCVGLAAVLAEVTARERVPGYWQYLTGGGAVVAGAAGAISWAQDYKARSVRKDLANYAHELERNPAMTNRLADYLGAHVTDREIQDHGLDEAVMMNTNIFAMENHLYFKNGSTPSIYNP